MNKMKMNVGIAMITLTILSCDKGPFPEYEKTETGVFYQFFNKSDGESKPKASDFVIVNMKLTNENDSTLFDSKKVPNTPDGGIMFPLMESRLHGNLEEGLLTMNKGDSASFIVLADSVYKGAQLPKSVVKGSYIKFFVKLINVRTKDDVMGEQKKLTEEASMRSEQARQKDGVDCAKYISDNHITVKPSVKGLYYIEKKKGTGDLIKQGQTVSMKYTGKLLNGQVFDSSDKNGGQPYPFTVGAGQVIPGWEEAAVLMRKGGKAIIIIPSSLAYGDQGQGPIPPNATLVFDVEAVDVK